jgi:hypothetical protein
MLYRHVLQQLVHYIIFFFLWRIYVICLAKFIWRLVRIRCGVRPLNNIRHIFGSWLTSLDNRMKSHFILGASAICWAIWLSRNDAVFIMDGDLHLDFVFSLISAHYVLFFLSF